MRKTKPKTQTKQGPNKLSQAENIRQYIRANPDKPLSEVARIVGTTYQVVYMTKRAMLDKENKLKKDTITVSTVEEDEAFDTLTKQISVQPVQIEMFEPASDPVNHPAHYKVGGIDTIDFIEAKKLNYNLGNVVKYITRADHKGNRKQDLEKALWYLKRELSAV